MNKLDLVNAVSEACSLSKKDAESAVNAVIAEVSKALENGDDVKLSGFGTFLVKERKERVGTVPGTNDKITIPATKTVGFKPSKNLKEAVK